MQEKEIWKDIDGFCGDYQISNRGRLKSFKCNREKILSTNTLSNGYPIAQLLKNGVVCREYIHTIVAKTFIKKMYAPLTVHHIDFDKTNNSVSNLELISLVKNSRLGNGKKNVKGYVEISIGRFLAQITIDYNLIKLGEFFTEEEASTAYHIAVENIDEYFKCTERQFIDLVFDKWLEIYYPKNKR